MVYCLTARYDNAGSSQRNPLGPALRIVPLVVSPKCMVAQMYGLAPASVCVA